jgi:hypothetical protein
MQLALHSRDDFRHTARSPDADQPAENLVILIGIIVTESKTRKLTRGRNFSSGRPIDEHLLLVYFPHPISNTVESKGGLSCVLSKVCVRNYIGEGNAALTGGIF